MKLRFPDKTYTVIVMSDGGAQIRKRIVRGRTLNWVVGGAAALAFVLVAAVVTSVLLGRSLASDSARVEAARWEKSASEFQEKLADANRDVKHLQSKVDSMNASLGKVREYASRLRRFTHLSDPERNLAMGPIAAREGEEGDEGPGAVDTLTSDEGADEHAKERRKMRAGLVTRRLAGMTTQAAAAEKELDALEKHFKSRQIVLESTPSIWPVRGVFASGFGMRRDPISGAHSFHKGIDIFADTGTPIIASAGGTISFAANKGGYGLHVIVDHGFGVKTRYAHMSKCDVEVGQKVKRGDRLGLVGSTGRSTGPHLHYEVIVGGVPQHPKRYILD